ncbi:hypothetical protein PUN28_002771 [Cardiocondyla obscurior]|uniref:Uncharacterized protein n=1 Tax=Cardiocondyla obscurior TaxID=286306 RepID=A0AAW2GW16_9HYME
MRVCLCMDDAVTSLADVNPRLCIYLRTTRHGDGEAKDIGEKSNKTKKRYAALFFSPPCLLLSNYSSRAIKPGFILNPRRYER